jgi:hypothetical protein
MTTAPKKMTPAEAEMLQEAKDKKAAPKLEKAYNESLTTTVPAPAPAASEPKKMANGGVTRADGCISKGHTKGKMV